MNFPIRTKFIGILIIAALLPLGIALIVFRWFGEDYYRKSQGQLFEEAASHFSSSLSLSLQHEIDRLDQWHQFSGFTEKVEDALKQQPVLSEPERTAAIQALESEWPRLTEDSRQLRALLETPLAKALRAYQSKNPDFAEIFVTDPQGRLLAATQKTTDYWQADESWWQEVAQLDAGMAAVNGLNFDTSAKVYSIDVAFPLFLEKDGRLQNVGVLKAVINASPVFQGFFASLQENAPTHEVILQNGQVLVSSNNAMQKPMSKSIASAATETLCCPHATWILSNGESDKPVVYGAAPIRIKATAESELQLYGLEPMWAIVHQSDDAIMAPVYSRLQWVMFSGALLVTAFVVLGYFIASSKILSPILKLQQAAKSVSSTVQLDEAQPNRAKHQTPTELLAAVEAIHTQDEIEELAKEFSFMARRILSYQEKLESEIETQTQAIHKDLEFAREFQVKLMPQNYPELLAKSTSNTLGMKFHHLYKPASSVGGDFFDVLQLSDSKVGIFIADVMGHGVRSALITAILATLLHDNEAYATSPAEFLKHLNQHFYKMVHKEDEVIFASAFYLVLDLKSQTAKFATAGHPSPLLINHKSGQVEQLAQQQDFNPVIGLFPECTYETYERPLHKDDLFLMFTDGVYECSNTDEQEFGQERLKALVEKNSHRDLPSLTNLILKTISEYTYPNGLDDDICLVGVELFDSMHLEAPSEGTEVNATSSAGSA